MQNYVLTGAFLGVLLHSVIQNEAFVAAVLGALIGAVLYLNKRLQVLGNGANPPKTPSQPLHVTPKTATKAAKPIEIKAATPNKIEVPAKPKVAQPQKVLHQESIFKPLFAYLIGTNPLVRIGGVVLFFGMAFLAKYAIAHSVITVQMRLLGMTLLAFILVYTGWRLRERQGHYGLIIQGLGVAMLYLVIYASVKLYAFIGLQSAFVWMLSVVLFGAFLALKQNALPMMLFATFGGFLAPILTASGQGGHIVLFSYYLLLNVGIGIIALYRVWRILNIMGFVLTLVIGIYWGMTRYEASMLYSCELFVVLFFLLYLAITILFTTRQSLKLKDSIDTTLLFGLPFSVFMIQSVMLREIAYATSASAIAMGALYLLLSKLLWNRNGMRLLSESFLALGVIFMTLSIPYALDGEWTALSWSLEATALLWATLRYKRTYGVNFAIVLQMLSTLLYCIFSLIQVVHTPFLNALYIGAVVLFGSLIVSAWLIKYFNDDTRKPFEMLFFLSALAVMLIAGARELWTFDLPHGHAMLLYGTLLGAVVVLLHVRLSWSTAAVALEGFGVYGLLWYAKLAQQYEHAHPFVEYGWLAYGLFFTMQWFLLRRYEARWQFALASHVMTLLLAAALLSTELFWQVHNLTLNDVYANIAFVAVPLGLLFALLKYRFWPLHISVHVTWSATIMVLVMLVWTLYAIPLEGAFGFWLYIPLVNPLELVQIAILVLSAIWWQKHHDRLAVTAQGRLGIVRAFWALAVVLLSVALARSIHAYAGVAYSVTALWQSALFQTALALLWSLIAFALILRAKNRQNRDVWIGGAILLGLVIAKLFLVDLANSATLERIISFSVVGVLILIIGYIAPLPPKEDSSHT